LGICGALFHVLFADEVGKLLGNVDNASTNAYNVTVGDQFAQLKFIAYYDMGQQSLIACLVYLLNYLLLT